MKHILIIDDSSNIRVLVKKILHTKGHHVEEASSVAEGLIAAAKIKFDLILLDYEMPEADGPVFLMKREGEAFSSVPVVMLSGLSDDSFLQKVKSLGAVGTILKPFSPSQLIQSVSEFLS